MHDSLLVSLNSEAVRFKCHLLEFGQKISIASASASTNVINVVPYSTCDTWRTNKTKKKKRRKLVKTQLTWFTFRLFRLSFSFCPLWESEKDKTTTMAALNNRRRRCLWYKTKRKKLLLLYSVLVCLKQKGKAFCIYKTTTTTTTTSRILSRFLTTCRCNLNGQTSPVMVHFVAVSTSFATGLAGITLTRPTTMTSSSNKIVQLN